MDKIYERQRPQSDRKREQRPDGTKKENNILSKNITSNVNGLSIPIKKQRESNRTFKKKQDFIVCCLQEANFKYKVTNRLKVEKTDKYILSTLTKIKLEWQY